MPAILATLAAFSSDRLAACRDGGQAANDMSIIDAIHSPVTAAAVFLVAVAKAGCPISDATACLISDELKRLSGRGDVTELLVFSGWITEHERCPSMMAGKFGPLWRRSFSRARRHALIAAADGVAASGVSRSSLQTEALAAARAGLGG